MLKIDYEHSANEHSPRSPLLALPILLKTRTPRSLLDVGCGTGTWLKAALECGITDVLGIDGIDLDERQMLIAKSAFKRVDLNESWDLGRRFDLALCLEVAEHLSSASAGRLIRSLTLHADSVLFSAACPGQGGQHHVNCQWPDYWQELFNREGYRCDDSVRWQIWDHEGIEPWYRQNLMVAVRDPVNAGQEPRIPKVLHPDMLGGVGLPNIPQIQHDVVDRIVHGSQPVSWYAMTSATAVLRKARRWLFR